jgi:hypothetical protein
MRDWKAEVAARLRDLRLDGRDDVIEEVAQHVEQRYRLLRAEGTTEETAYREAMEELSDPAALARELHDIAPPRPDETGGFEPARHEGATTRSIMLESIAEDVRYAVRSFRRTPGFTLVVVLTLALAIGANTAIFSVFDTVILRPLPYRDGDRLYVIQEGSDPSRPPRGAVNALHFREWRASTRSFEDMALLGPNFFGYTLTGAGEPVRIHGARATPNLFRMLGVEPALGRGFLDEEDVPGKDEVVILGHDLWSSQFGADLDIIGR